KDSAILPPDGSKVYSLGGAVKEPGDLGIEIHCQSRGLLEYCTRECAKDLANINFQSDSAVRGPIYGNSRVSGVTYTSDEGSHSAAAGLVVDTGGRGSHALGWISRNTDFPYQRKLPSVLISHSQVRGTGFRTIPNRNACFLLWRLDPIIQRSAL